MFEKTPRNEDLYKVEKEKELIEKLLKILEESPIVKVARMIDNSSEVDIDLDSINNHPDVVAYDELKERLDELKGEQNSPRDYKPT